MTSRALAEPVPSASTPPDGQASDQPGHARTETPVLLLTFLFAGGVINYMDRAIIGLVGPGMRADLGLSAGEFGLVMSAFSIGYTIFAIFGGWAADKFGAFRILLFSMTVWSLFCGLTGIVSSLWMLIVVRFLFGVGEAPWLAAFNKLLTERIPKERFSTFHSLLSSGQPLGGVVAGPVVGFVAAAFGWRAGFYAVGAIGISWALLWVLLVHRRHGEDRKTAVAQEIADDVAESDVSRRSLLSNGTIWAAMLGMACSTYFIVYFFSWYPSYLNAKFGMSVDQLGLLTSLPWIVGVFAYAVGGALSDWLAKVMGSLLKARKTMMVSCMALASMVAAIVPSTDSVTLSISLMSAAIGLLYLAGSTYFAIGLSATPRHLVGFVSGNYLFVSNLAAALCPFISGYLIEWTQGYDASLYLSAALPMSAAFMAFVVIGRWGIRSTPRQAG